jgi:two-component system, cell cycle sensor histidine kinase and response regulator CckA
MSRPLRVLMVEDSPADAELLLHELSKSDYDVTSIRVDTGDGLRQALGGHSWDIVVSDYSMPAFTAPDALRILAESGLDIPFIIVSGTIGEETAVNSLKAGACDFLVKGRLTRLVPTIERERREADLRRERARAHAALEDELRQAQKLEAIGQLAGSVAHDFNNMLTAILGYAELLTEQIGPDKPIGRDLQEIVAAAQRAAALTRQLLAFGRKQAITPVILSVNGIIEDLQPMLRRLINANISIRVKLDPNVNAVVADATQLEQVLLNLAVNARDAMIEGGALTIETQNQTIDETDRAYGPTSPPPGTYVVVRVTDTGCGMSQAVQARIFEPFFTTKERGHGTGLGLAAVYGIVKQLNGNILVNSEPGRGTVFTVCLPATGQPAAHASAAQRQSSVPVGNETILLVEDEPGVRRFAKTILMRHGYHVVEADSSETALAGLAGEPVRVDLLLTDLMLSGRHGGELATDLRRTRPDLPVLFMSGYANSAVRTGLPDGCTVLEKPFTAHTLLWLVGDALGRR